MPLTPIGLVLLALAVVLQAEGAASGVAVVVLALVAGALGAADLLRR